MRWQCKNSTSKAKCLNGCSNEFEFWVLEFFFHEFSQSFLNVGEVLISAPTSPGVLYFYHWWHRKWRPTTSSLGASLVFLLVFVCYKVEGVDLFLFIIGWCTILRHVSETFMIPHSCLKRGNKRRRCLFEVNVRVISLLKDINITRRKNTYRGDRCSSASWAMHLMLRCQWSKPIIPICWRKAERTVAELEFYQNSTICHQAVLIFKELWQSSTNRFFFNEKSL